MMSDQGVGDAIETLANKAADFLEGQLHRTVREVLIHFNQGDSIAVFEMEAEPVRTKGGQQVTRWWVVSGAKMPTTFTVKDRSPGPKTVLGQYVEVMKKWADAIAAGEKPPVRIYTDMPENPKYAGRVRKAVDTIEQAILPKLKDR
jgi:hypothetical protein